MDLQALLANAAAKLETFLPGLADDEAATVGQLSKDLRDGADQVAAAVKPSLPVELQPFVPDMVAFFDAEVAKAQCAADARIAQGTAAKAAILAAAAGAGPT
jgi:hypothetical protein